MAKTETLRTRMEPELKAQGESILSALGLSTSEAITIFFRQMVMHKGLPFEVKIPNAETISALEEPRADMKRFSSVKGLMADLKSD